MSGQTAVVIGATGLIGSHVLEQLLNNDYFDVVRVLVRRQLDTNHPKLQQQVVDFNDINDYTNKFGPGDIIFCCVGTTQKKVKGDKAAYYKVDHDIPVNAAMIGAQKGFRKYLLVSAAGANAASSNFYLKLKGETENDIKQYAFESISFFRPSMLLGKRNESRSMEKVKQWAFRAASVFLYGSLKKYRPIQAKDVARAMIAQSKLNPTCVTILEYEQMMQLIVSPFV